MPLKEQYMKTSNDTDTKKIVKKSDKLTLKQMKSIEEAEDQQLLANTDNSTAPVVEVEEKPVAISEPRVPDYIPLLDNPPVQSVGNSGWQVSDGRAGYSGG
jgi:CRISPR/Cas system CSM-associated protein Csm4 (group 5 of RAMP superfamily)